MTANPRQDDPVVRTIGLTKRFRDGIEAVRGLDLSVRRGEIYGFLGPNGAGKTTTLMMLLGLEQPTAGQLELFGRQAPVDPFGINRRIGVVGEHQYLYEDLSGWEYLQFFARLYEVKDARRRAAELLDRLGLYEFRRLRATEHSRGMQQKLGLARALLHRPELLILDEPVSGLDPRGIRQVRELLLEERASGTTIVISSHILSEIERTADRVGILHAGRLVAEDVVERVGARLDPGTSVELDLDRLSTALVDSLREQPFVTSIDVAANGNSDSGRLQVRVTDGADHRRAISSLVTTHGALILNMQQRRLSLEDAFVRLTDDNVTAAFPSPVFTAVQLPSSVRVVLSTPRGGWRPRAHAIRTLARHEVFGLLTGLGTYVTVAIGMLVTTFMLRGHLDALAHNHVLILADAFSLPFFVSATLAMLFLALTSAATVARERERGTLETLFYGPVDHIAYLLAKQVAHVAAYIPMVALVGVLYAAYASLTGFSLDGSYVLELVVSVATAAAVVALGLLLSTLTSSVRTAYALLAGLSVLFLTLHFGSDLLSSVRVVNNYSPLLFARNAVIVLDRVLQFVSPFSVLSDGVDAVVRSDPLDYLRALGLSLLQGGLLLAAATRTLGRRGVRHR